ncbi:alcohol dehydrogenase catalytic domain-containing protein, partial [Microbacterium sp. ISL-103]|uniref:alcohol dehydrogenase catalytic domain-containing protein n=1 Tax=Microbacterium sp. ISL-103 TaxID=2819156 RepID=UPI001BE7964F
MKAIGVATYGGPDALNTFDLPLPPVHDNEVRIKVHAAAINPADVMLREGHLAAWYSDLEPPYIPGMDISGVVHALGTEAAQTSGLRVGQSVVAIVDNQGAHGGYSEYVSVPAASVVAAPNNVSIERAATFLMSALPARAAL